jgi:Flp pilus assembly protein TadG
MTRRQNQRGQAIVETAIVIVIFLFLAGGVIHFGYSFMVANMITHAARDGARLAASWQSRDACGALINTDPITNNSTGAVATRIAAVIAQTDERFTVAVSQSPPVTVHTPPCASAGTTPTVTVNVQGCIPYLFNIFGFTSNCTTTGSPSLPGVSVNRNATFADELRGTFG